MIVTPQTKVLDVAGMISYEERTRAWTMIRLKKEITYAFPLLKERQTRMKYKLMVFFSLSAFNEYAQKVLQKEVDVPMLLYFERDDAQKL